MRTFATLLVIASAALVLLISGCEGGSESEYTRYEEAAVIVSIPLATPTSVEAGVTFNHTFQATGRPSPSLLLLNAPSWASLTGDTLAATPPASAVGGLFVFTVQANNGIGAPATQAVTLLVVAAPQIVSTPPSTPTVVGIPWNYAVQALGYPTPQFSLGAGAPSWLAFNGSSLQGTPPASDAGFTLVFDVIADNGVGVNAAQQLTLDVMNPPQITSTPPANPAFVVASTAFNYAVIATGIPAPQLSLSGAPAWLAFTGNILAGTPGAADVGQTFSFSVIASNGYGADAIQQLTINVVTAGTLRWSYATADVIFSSPAIAPDGTVYVGSADKFVYAFTPAGTLKWTYSLGYFTTSSPAVGPDGTIYIGASDSKLHAIKPDGSGKWQCLLTGFALSSPSLATNGDVYIGTSSGNFYSISSAGVINWMYTTGGAIVSTPAIAPSGTVYFGSGDKNLYALDSAGTLLWSFATGATIKSSPAIAQDGSILFGSQDFNLRCLDTAGNLKWSYATSGMVDSSPTIAADGTIYVGSADKKLHAVNPDGTPKWSYLTGDVVWSSVTITTDGTLYFGSNDKHLYALDAAGNLLWKSITGNWVRSSPAIGQDGTIYVGSHDKSFYAFHGANGTLASTPWPKFRANDANTGRR
ncbi:eukaryotic-like serine/threonine-protein kinase [Planctomycetaceae bacterium]|nr:eukaryotic-like serine/threonine-protein kinase [Planctomycetaceae bacterium]